MQGMLLIVSGILLVVFAGLASVWLYRQVFFFEGVRLNSRLHRWLYDRWAVTYDRDKKKVQLTDAQKLISPLMQRLLPETAESAETLVLDIATGTGRFPAVLLANDRFKGRVIGIDISSGMLQQAEAKLGEYGSRVVLLNQSAMPLPFPDETFVAVSCLETIELLSEPEFHLREFFRVLEPGGLLLISRNTGEWGLRGAVCSPEIFSARLTQAGFEHIEITAWWRWFDLVWAAKPSLADESRPK